MRAWRLTRRIHAAFDGEGSRLFGGRWSPPDTPVVYTSGTASLAALEYFVQLVAAQAPDDLVLIPVEIPDDLPTQALGLAALPPDWREYPAPDPLAQLGGEWVHTAATALLRVPSAIVPHESNYLLNPSHRDFTRLRVAAPEPFSLDPRLWMRPGRRRPRRA